MHNKERKTKKERYEERRESKNREKRRKKSQVGVEFMEIFLSQPPRFWD